MKKNADAIRIVFWGTASFAVPLLQSLARDSRFEIVGVVTRPDEPAGRLQILTPPPVKIAAKELGLPILQPASIKEALWMRSYADLRPDVAVVAAYGKIIPERILDIPAHKTLNVHPSLLPKYRGASPIQAAIANGDEETGVTIMLLDAEMDHGPILAQETVRLSGRETAPELENRLAEVGAAMLPDAIAGLARGEITPRLQDHGVATFTGMIDREDGRADWTRSAVEIERLFRAYQPWPGLWTKWRRKGRTRRIKILTLSPADEVAPAPPGAVLQSGRDLVVICRPGAVRISRVQPEGKKEMSAEEFLRGHPDVIGSTFG